MYEIEAQNGKICGLYGVSPYNKIAPNINNIPETFLILSLDLFNSKSVHNTLIISNNTNNILTKLIILLFSPDDSDQKLKI
jgi:hypothetical protein